MANDARPRQSRLDDVGSILGERRFDGGRDVRNVVAADSLSSFEEDADGVDLEACGSDPFGEEGDEEVVERLLGCSGVESRVDEDGAEDTLRGGRRISDRGGGEGESMDFTSTMSATGLGAVS